MGEIIYITHGSEIKTCKVLNRLPKVPSAFYALELSTGKRYIVEQQLVFAITGTSTVEEDRGGRSDSEVSRAIPRFR